MKKIVIFLFLFVFSSASFVFSQEKTSTDYYQSYLEKYRRYQSLSEKYNIAKSRHLAYQSVSSRAEYLLQAKSYLLAEIEAVEEYAKMIRTRLAEATSILNYQENYFFIKLDDEISFFAQAKKRVENSNSVSELSVVWKEFDTHYKKTSQFGYAIKAYIEAGSLAKILSNLKITSDKIKNFVATASADNPLRIAAEDKFVLVGKNLQKAEKIVSELNNSQENFQKYYNSKSSSESIFKKYEEGLDLLNESVLSYGNIISSLIDLE